MEKIANISANGKLSFLALGWVFSKGCDPLITHTNNNLMNTYYLSITVLSIWHILFHLILSYRRWKRNWEMLSILVKVPLLFWGRAGDSIECQGAIKAALQAEPLRVSGQTGSTRKWTSGFSPPHLIHMLGRVNITFHSNGVVGSQSQRWGKHQGWCISMLLFYRC